MWRTWRSKVRQWMLSTPCSYRGQWQCQCRPKSDILRWLKKKIRTSTNWTFRNTLYSLYVHRNYQSFNFKISQMIFLASIRHFHSVTSEHLYGRDANWEENLKGSCSFCQTWENFLSLLSPSTVHCEGLPWPDRTSRQNIFETDYRVGSVGCLVGRSVGRLSCEQI